MKVSSFTAEDIPALTEIGANTGYPYPDLLTDSHIAALSVVRDDNGEIIMACAAKTMIEHYLYVGIGSTITKMRALELLHKHLAEELRQQGYSESSAYLPPSVAGKFARRLHKSFGWIRNPWENWFVRF